MKALEYYNKQKRGEWVPDKGDIVEFREIKGWHGEGHDNPILSEQFSNGHTVTSIFMAKSGNMCAFITGRRAHVLIEQLTRAKPETGPHDAA